MFFISGHLTEEGILWGEEVGKNTDVSKLMMKYSCKDSCKDIVN